MIKKSAIAYFIASAIIFATPALAQDSTTSSVLKREENLQDRINKETRLIEQRKTMEVTKDAKFKQKMEALKAKIATREAEVKLKLQQFKDKQKANVATRVNTNLNKINQNQTTEMLKHLDKMTELMDKLVIRVNQGTPDIKDPKAANQAIADARLAIDNARIAVQAQAQKDYTIAVTTETKIKVDAKAKRDELYKDMMAIRKMVIEAKQKASDAVRIARGGPKTATPSSQVKEGTTSGQQ